MRKVMLAYALLLLGAIHSAVASTYVVGIPANASATTQTNLEGFFAKVFDNLKPRDTLVVMDANHLKPVAQFIVPDDIPATPKARARFFGPYQGKINEAIGEPDTTSLQDNLNIPTLLRELGTNIFPKLAERDNIHVVILGSIMWESPKNSKGTWTFRDYIPSDGFLTKPIGVFNILGQEKMLAGSLVSVCYTDKINDFQREGFRRETINFWGKSVVGRGGKVGSFQPADDDCATRLFSKTEDPTPYVIDRNADVYLMQAHWVTVQVK